MVALVLLSTLGVLLLGLIVFGGGQVFMPLFKALWQLMGVKDDTINNVFAIANSTPGVVSTKFGLFTGYLVANGQWWGYLAMIGTYLIFALPSIVMILVSTKMIKKTRTNKYLKNTIIFLRPIIIGVLITLSIQLLLGTMVPWFSFNSFTKGYTPAVGYKDNAGFFTGWRMWVLLTWLPTAIAFSLYWLKKKRSLLLLIIIFVIIGLLIFAPWL